MKQSLRKNARVIHDEAEDDNVDEDDNDNNSDDDASENPIDENDDDASGNNIDVITNDDGSSLEGDLAQRETLKQKLGDSFDTSGLSDNELKELVALKASDYIVKSLKEVKGMKKTYRDSVEEARKKLLEFYPTKLLFLAAQVIIKMIIQFSFPLYDLYLDYCKNKNKINQEMGKREKADKNYFHDTYNGAFRSFGAFKKYYYRQPER